MDILKNVFLQAYAQKKSDNKLEVTLKAVYGMHKVVPYVFTLPDNQAAFKGLINTLYNQGADKSPSYVTKGEFREKFIDYTLGLNFDSINPEELTEHYNTLFKLTEKEGKEVIVGLDVAEASYQKEAAAFQKELKALRAEAMISYKESKSDTPMPQAETPTDNIYDDPDELDIGSVPGPAPLNRSSKPTVCGVGGKAPVKNLENLGEVQKRALQNAGKTTRSKLQGINATKLMEPAPAPMGYAGDYEAEGINNAGIICGRDEYYRLRGHPKAGAVYIYAGRSPNDIKVQKAAQDGKAAQYVKKPNDLVRDSAYVYISQKADPDELLKVAGGTFSKIVGGKQPRKGVSLVALKADDVVIASRVSGIRLITGTDSKNTDNCDMFAKYGIDLIAGNNDKDLQPLVKGDNLVIYLKNLSKALDDLRAVVYTFFNKPNRL